MPAAGPDLLSGFGDPVIRIHTDLADALNRHGAPAEPTGEVREWRSGGWPHRGTRI